jgi:hypothetical protein
MRPVITSAPQLTVNTAGAVSSYINATTAEIVQIGYSCNVSFIDPSDDIMRAVNEITFRTAVAAANSTTPLVSSQSIRAEQSTSTSLTQLSGPHHLASPFSAC